MGLCTLRRVRIVAATLAVSCAIAGCGKREEPPAGAQAPAPKPPARLTAPEPAAPPVAAPTPSIPAPQAAAPQAAPAPAAPPPIGKVDSLEGKVRLARAGVERAAQAGMTLEQGDALKSGPESWALLAMVDGATVTIRPDTEVRVDAYRYVPDGNPGDNTASWSLVRGALRSITGLIGKSNPPGYQVKTPTATIGIRGTDHEPAYYPPPAPGEKAEHPPGTYDKVNSGESVLRSARGTIPVRKGQTAFANVQAQTKPQILARPPAFYQRQAEVDRRVAPRREQFHKDYEQERQKQLQVLRVQQQEAAKKAQDERKGKQLEAQKQRFDAQKQQQEARKAEQEKRKVDQQQKRDAQKKSDQKSDQRKSDQKPDQGKSDQKKARDKSSGAALPPSVAERIRNMQRGDKAAPGSAARREAAPDTQAGQKGQSQRAQPQAQSQRAQPQPQRAQPQQQQQASPFQALPQRLQPQQQNAQPQQQPQRAQPQTQKGQQQQQRDPRQADQQGR